MELYGVQGRGGTGHSEVPWDPSAPVWKDEDGEEWGRDVELMRVE